MTDFHCTSKVTAAKQHHCAHCQSAIEIGQRHWRAAQVFEGHFEAYREHFDCRSAWHTLNFDIRDCDPAEGAPFLKDDEWCDDSRAWMREQFPIVADRLGFFSARRPEKAGAR